MEFKTYGCSYTEYQWPTWTHWLEHDNKVKRYGVPGWGNEDIARSLILNCDTKSTQVVMWSAFDRVSRDANKKWPYVGEGKYTGSDYNKERLLSRTYEQIYLANRYCADNNIKIFNFTAFPLELGEDTELHKIKHPLKKDMPTMPISFAEFCLDHHALHPNIKDRHPTVYQHLKYYNDVMCPVLDTKTVDKDISEQELYYSKLETKSNWKTYSGPINFIK